MKTLATGILSLMMLAPGLLAAGLTRLPDTGETVGELIRKHTPTVVSESARRKDSVVLDVTDSALLIQGAGSIHGANNTYFHSDLAIANYRSTTQVIAVGWLAQGVDNANSLVQYFSIPPNTIAALDDFVAGTLGKSGLGAVVIVGATSSHNVDSSATFDASSRIWTNQPNANGTVSLTLNAVSLNDSLGSLTAYAIGLKQNQDFRTNVGIVNLDSVAHTWTVEASGTGGYDTIAVKVPAYSMDQVAIAPGNFGNLFLALTSDGFGFWWSAYGVSVDNTTADGWVTHAIQP